MAILISITIALARPQAPGDWTTIIMLAIVCNLQKPKKFSSFVFAHGTVVLAGVIRFASVAVRNSIFCFGFSFEAMETGLEIITR